MAFDVKSITRNRTVGWGVVEPGSKARAITTADCIDDAGKVDADFCKRFSIDPATVNYITVNDLPKAYSENARAAVAALAAEWSTGKDEKGNLIKWTADEVTHYLVLQSRMQDAANASIKQHRPVSDKALDRAVSTFVKTMKANGKTLAEVTSVMAATGMKATQEEIREAYGA